MDSEKATYIDKKATGLAIKEARNNKQLTQTDLANLVGVSKSLIGKWENADINNISDDNLKKLSDALDVDLFSVYYPSLDSLNITDEDIFTNYLKRLSAQIYCYAGSDEHEKLIINTASISQDDHERILGILAKYDKPRIKL